MQPRPPIILYVEENQMLLQTVGDVFEFAGWYVKPCPDFGIAYALIESQHHFDVLLIAHDRHGELWLKLARRVRQLSHRQRTPLILTSLEERSADAQQTGADAFLRKPLNLIDLVDTIRQLLAANIGLPGQ